MLVTPHFCKAHSKHSFFFPPNPAKTGWDNQAGGSFGQIGEYVIHNFFFDRVIVRSQKAHMGYIMGWLTAWGLAEILPVRSNRGQKKWGFIA